MFKVEGLWVMVFWQRTQRQNMLMIFPYGLKKVKKKKKEYLYVFLLMMTTETSKAVFPLLAAFSSLEFLQKGLL